MGNDGAWRRCVQRQGVVNEWVLEIGVPGLLNKLSGSWKSFGRRGALAAPCYVWSHFYYPLLIVNLLIYSMKMICTHKLC